MVKTEKPGVLRCATLPCLIAPLSMRNGRRIGSLPDYGAASAGAHVAERLRVRLETRASWKIHAFLPFPQITSRARERWILEEGDYGDGFTERGLRHGLCRGRGVIWAAARMSRSRAINAPWHLCRFGHGGGSAPCGWARVRWIWR